MVILICFTLWAFGWWLLGTVFARHDIADIAWGLGFIVVTAYTHSQMATVHWLVYCQQALVMIWGVRLSAHIGLRVLRSHTEDRRYAQWRIQHGGLWRWRSLLQVYLLQSAILLIVSMPIWLLTISSASSVHWWQSLGLVIALVGLSIESVSDWQLKQFVSNKINQGQLIQSGLWRYSRHPNYVGEVVFWWGIAAIAFQGTLFTLLVWLGPITIHYLIAKVSGVPMLEESLSGRPGWHEYAQKTPALFPSLFKNKP